MHTVPSGEKSDKWPEAAEKFPELLEAMLKKRLIFTLLFERGNFMLSRNFRLQKVGDLKWLQKNYNFANVSFFIDELIIVDVTREGRDIDSFAQALSLISQGCFAPISAGGGIGSLEDAKKLLRSGADKVMLNSTLVKDPEIAGHIAREYGRQCVVGAVDVYRNARENYSVFIENGGTKVEGEASKVLASLPIDCVGE